MLARNRGLYGIRAALIALALAALAGCGGDDGKKAATSCGADGDCGDGLCVASACLTGCTSKTDCAADEDCLPRTGTAGVEATVCVAATGLAADSLAGLSVVFHEQIDGADDIVNTWVFGPDADTTGKATLTNAGLEAAFTYDVTGPSTSTLTFDVQGTDQYDLTWTSADGGTFSESFEGEPGTTGTFTATTTPLE